jgi:hypothetical protein
MISDEKLNADTTGMRMPGVAGRGDATTQLAAGILSLQASFPDRERRFDIIVWFYGLGLFGFFDNGFILVTMRQHLAWPKHLTEPEGDLLDDLRQPLDR